MSLSFHPAAPHHYHRSPSSLFAIFALYNANFASFWKFNELLQASAIAPSITLWKISRSKRMSRWLLCMQMILKYEMVKENAQQHENVIKCMAQTQQVLQIDCIFLAIFAFFMNIWTGKLSRIWQWHFATAIARYECVCVIAPNQPKEFEPKRNKERESNRYFCTPPATYRVQSQIKRVIN